MGSVAIFAPSPTLTVTVEGNPDGDEIHFHAGGQGVWQARMLAAFDIDVTICCVLSGESGSVIQHLLENAGITVAAIERPGRASTYVHDRRGGERRTVAEEIGDPLERHVLDDLYGTTLREGADSDVMILSGPVGDQALPPDTYRRLATDVRHTGCRVVADLSGGRLDAALQGGIDVLKVSDEELRADGALGDDAEDAVVTAMHVLRDRGARTVIVTRAAAPLLLLDDAGVLEVTPPELQIADSRGAGDSLTAGVVAGLVRGESLRDAITLGVAAGALNVTRRGLGTGDPATIERLRPTVRRRDVGTLGPETGSGRVSPAGLASLAAMEADE